MGLIEKKENKSSEDMKINKDEKGWFCGKHYKFCPDCGQRLRWED